MREGHRSPALRGLPAAQLVIFANARRISGRSRQVDEVAYRRRETGIERHSPLESTTRLRECVRNVELLPVMEEAVAVFVPGLGIVGRDFDELLDGGHCVAWVVRAR